MQVLNLLFVCCKVNGRVRKEPQTGGEVSFPKPSKSLILIDEKKTLPETPLAMKGAHLTLDLNHFQRRSDGFTENPGEPDAHKTLSPRQPVVFFHRGHRRLALSRIRTVPAMVCDVYK